MALLLTILTMIVTLVPAQVEITPKLIQPTDFSLDEVKLTDIDSIPGYTVGEDKVKAVGYWYDSSANEYVIFVMSIIGEGATYSTDFAFKMQGTHVRTAVPSPKIYYEGTKYLVSI